MLLALASAAATAQTHKSDPTRAPAPQGFLAKFRDPEDGRLDASAWLLDHRGALPVPILITEPAVDYGGGVALLFFRRPEGAAQTWTNANGVQRPIAPDIYGAFGARTRNGTKAWGGGASMHFRDDRWRYVGGVAQPDIHLDYYLPARDGGTRRIAYAIDGLGSMQQVQRRIGNRDLYVGLRWVYLDFDARLDVESDSDAFDPRDFKQRNSGLGATLEYDVRDNPFTPSSGWIGGVDATVYATSLGGDRNYSTVRGRVFAYTPVAHDRVVLAGRVDVRAAYGDVPFYVQPFVELRGVPAARYQDTRTAVLEGEVRWNVTPRWAAVGFAGVGRAWGHSAFDDAATPVTKGVGGRYLVARRLGLYAGVDYAWGPEDGAVYIQVGGAWR
ncbi:MAG: BamA/TamA family outer membrane protein [Pseudoxanthomonas sp.]